MPTVITEDFSGGHPTAEQVAYSDLPLEDVVDLAMCGDPQAIAWMKNRANAMTAAGDFDESKHPRDSHGRFGDKADSGPPEVAVPTRLNQLSSRLQADIRDRAEGAGVKPEETLSPGWRNAAAWDAVLTSDARALDDPKAEHPDRYEGKYGGTLKVGETEPKLLAPGDGQQPPRIVDVTPMPPGMSTDDALKSGRIVPGYGGGMRPLVSVPGSERPPDSLYRVMSTAEYDQALERGYIQTNSSMNLGPEGTVTSLGSTGSFYVPPPSLGASDYRIARIDYHADDGWRLDTDEYVKTDERIPMSHVSAVTEPLPNPRADETHASAMDELAFEFDEAKHPRDNRGRFGTKDEAKPQPSSKFDGPRMDETYDEWQTRARLERAARVAPPGWKVITPADERERKIGQYRTAGLSQRDAEYRVQWMEEKGIGTDAWAKGRELWQGKDGSTLDFYPGTHVPDEKKAELANTIDALQKVNPLGNEISVAVKLPFEPTTDDFKSDLSVDSAKIPWDRISPSVYGQASGYGQMNLNSEVFTRDADRRMVSAGERGFHPPSSADPDIPASVQVATHEYGHLLDARKQYDSYLTDPAYRDQKRVEIFQNERPASTYGAHNNQESYAEAFQQYVLGDPRLPDPPIATAYATLDGWKKP